MQNQNKQRPLDTRALSTHLAKTPGPDMFARVYHFRQVPAEPQLRLRHLIVTRARVPRLQLLLHGHAIPNRMGADASTARAGPPLNLLAAVPARHAHSLKAQRVVGRAVPCAPASADTFRD